MVLVMNPIADGPNVFPSDQRFSSEEIIRQMADGLGDDFEASLDTSLDKPVLSEALRCELGNRVFDT